MTLAFDDRRSVGGLNVPDRITRTSRGIVFEELVLTEIVNATLGVNDFLD